MGEVGDAGVRIKAAARPLGAGERGDGLADTAAHIGNGRGLCRQTGMAKCASVVLPLALAQRLFASTSRQLRAADQPWCAHRPMVLPARTDDVQSVAGFPRCPSAWPTRNNRTRRHGRNGGAKHGSRGGRAARTGDRPAGRDPLATAAGHGNATLDHRRQVDGAGRSGTRCDGR